MALRIEPIDPARPDFAGVVSSVDIAAGVSPAVAAEIEAGMDRFAVLVFRGQAINDPQQLAFSQHFGPMETATGDIVQGAERRLSMDINDISNLDKDGKVLARDDRKRLFSLGNMLWHSDSSFKATPAKFSLLSARVIPDHGGNTEFADMRAAWDALDDATQAEIRDLVCDHTQLHSRGVLGFTDFTEEERQALVEGFKEMKRAKFDKTVMERVFDEQYIERQQERIRFATQSINTANLQNMAAKGAQQTPPGTFITTTTNTGSGLMSAIGLGGVFK